MKSESLKKMMLRHIIILGLLSFTLGQSEPNLNKSLKKQQSEIKYMKSVTAIDLKKQQFQSTKERPELNPVLSALINEDVKKSIDAKRHAELELTPLPPAPSSTTTIPVLTTGKYVPKSSDDDSVVVDSIAGSSSEKKQTSRIEIKKGANGVDYEYEYVYYYYDDDEKDSKKLGSITEEKSSASRNGGKNQYKSDKNSSTQKPNSDRNELPSTRGKGRQSIPVVEEVAEERLPVNTRFPPRNAVTELSNVEETTKKISLKRPSLELVDSLSFSRGDKNQSKGSRIFENEFKKSVNQRDQESVAQSRTNLESDAHSIENNEVTTLSNDSDETTTQVMDKVALDLYAYLANENSNVDATTGLIVDEEFISESTENTSSADDYTTIIPSTTTITSTTTTTEASTTTSTTTTRTKTAETPVINGRRSPFGAERNRFKSRKNVAIESEKPPAESKELPLSESSTSIKPKNRFARPLHNARSRPTQTAAIAPLSEELPAVKQDARPTAASSPRGRTRNRFSLRSTTPNPSNEKNPDENAIENVVQSSSTQRSLRSRPAFHLRGRSRTTPSHIVNSSSENDSTEQAIAETKVVLDEKPTTPTPLKPVSRFNLRRPNQLLVPRGRLSPLAKTTSAIQSSEILADVPNTNENAKSSASEPLSHGEVSKETAAVDDSEQSTAEPLTTPQTGLSRLRNRPRIQIQPKAPSSNKPPTAASYSANRKVNPLISRRKIGTSSTTTEEPVAVENNETSEVGVEALNETKETNQSHDDGNAKEESTETSVEVSSEQPRGLGLLANRRRLAARRPGTIL